MRWLWLSLCVVAAAGLALVGLRVLFDASLTPGSYLLGLLLLVVAMVLLVAAVDNVR